MTIPPAALPVTAPPVRRARAQATSQANTPVLEKRLILNIVTGDVRPQHLNTDQPPGYRRVTEHIALDDVATDAPVGIEIDQRPLPAVPRLGDSRLHVVDGFDCHVVNAFGGGSLRCAPQMGQWLKKRIRTGSRPQHHYDRPQANDSRPGSQGPDRPRP
jgi:hypothetical protein